MDIEQASNFIASLSVEVQKFEDSLSDIYESKIVATFCGVFCLNCTGISLRHGGLIRFEGFDSSGNPAIILCSIEQVNLAILAQPRQLNSPKRKIGFSVDLPNTE